LLCTLNLYHQYFAQNILHLVGLEICELSSVRGTGNHGRSSDATPAKKKFTRIHAAKATGRESLSNVFSPTEGLGSPITDTSAVLGGKARKPVMSVWAEVDHVPVAEVTETFRRANLANSSSSSSSSTYCSTSTSTSRPSSSATSASETAASSDMPVTLPAGWRAAKTAEGAVYYYNKKTNETRCAIISRHVVELKKLINYYTQIA